MSPKAWSLCSPALIGHAVRTTENAKEEGEQQEEEAANATVEASPKLSGRYLLDLRSPADKVVFVAIARYALKNGADTWRNEMFQQDGIWKRFVLLRLHQRRLFSRFSKQCI